LARVTEPYPIPGRPPARAGVPGMGEGGLAAQEKHWWLIHCFFCLFSVSLWRN
jgi:hypothetical protein